MSTTGTGRRDMQIKLFSPHQILMSRLCELHNVIGSTLRSALSRRQFWPIAMVSVGGTVSTKHFRSAYLWSDNGLGPIGLPRLQKPLIDTHRHSQPWQAGRQAVREREKVVMHVFIDFAPYRCLWLRTKCRHWLRAWAKPINWPRALKTPPKQTAFNCVLCEYPKSVQLGKA